MIATAERLLSATDAARVHGIPAGTIRSWHNRRRFTGLWSYGLDYKGHPLFREADLLALRDKNAAKPRRKPGSS